MWAGFLASFLLVTLAELGDKTFFTPLILAMRHRRRWVFLGAWAALVLMTVLAVVAGQGLFRLLPPVWVQRISVAIFVVFGLKLLWQAYTMTPQQEREEEKEALQLVEQAEAHGAGRGGAWAVVTEAFTLTAMAELGDKTQVATLSLAAVHPGLSVFAGATLGHGLMMALAVLGGRWLAKHLSERAIHGLGGSLFLLFALLTAWAGSQ